MEAPTARQEVADLQANLAALPPVHLAVPASMADSQVVVAYLAAVAAHLAAPWVVATRPWGSSLCH